ncbi:nitroreductase family protein [Chloroflexota bacterium]
MLKRRAIRLFCEAPVPYEILNNCVNSARLAPSAANQQLISYIIVDDEQLSSRVFDTLHWAKYIRPAGDPPPGYRPRAYIVVLTKSEAGYKDWVAYDVGLAVENMILVALEGGIGSCPIVDINTNRLSKLLHIPKEYVIPLVLALGYPDESPIVEEFTGSIEYWKDQESRLHVPKRQLKDILHRNNFQYES